MRVFFIILEGKNKKHDNLICLLRQRVPNLDQFCFFPLLLLRTGAISCSDLITFLDWGHKHIKEPTRSSRYSCDRSYCSKGRLDCYESRDIKKLCWWQSRTRNGNETFDVRMQSRELTMRGDGMFNDDKWTETGIVFHEQCVI